MPELDTKQTIYQKIADYVNAKTGKNIGRSGGQELFNIVTEQVFASAVAEKNFRFNGGYGSLRIKNYSAGTRKLPSGKSTTFGERSKLRYEQGVTTTNLIDGKPVSVTPIPVAVEPAPKAAKTAAAAPAPATAPVTPAPADGAQVNLD